jgi:ubiquinone/menaquinone biosynthesis C-methylase UbiE
MRWHAAAYDVVCGYCERRGLLDARERLVSDLTGDIVEIGAGTGLNLPHYPAGARVTASDYDPVMLARAVPRAAAARATVRFLIADAMRLPFADRSIETLVWGLMLCSVPKPRLAFEEMKRVLKPGGRVRFVEHVRDEDESLRAKVQDAVAPAWKAFSGGCHCNRRTFDWLVGAGFEVTEVHRFNVGRSHIAPHVLAEATVLSVRGIR